MRALIIDDAAKSAVKRVLDHALDPRNLYEPGTTNTVPGDDPSFTVWLDTYRCVFTITKGDGGVFRHLSISVPSSSYPNPYAVYTIAQLFGFTGWDEKSFAPPEGWMIDLNKREHCVVLAQPYDSGKATA